MQNSIIHKAILLFLGLFLAIFGCWRVVGPIGFYAFSGLTLEADASLLNETRGAGGLIVASGFVVISGALFPAMAFTSSVISVLVFWSFAAARLLGIAVDGLPNGMMLQGLFFEILFGSFGAFALLRYRIVVKPQESLVQS
jgi:hypothetical protein